MSIENTYKHLKELLSHIMDDLHKSENGNKAASQRVRTGTVRLEKLAKSFRKESIVHEKKSKDKKAKSQGGAKKGTAAKGNSKSSASSKASANSKSNASSKGNANSKSNAKAAPSKSKAAPASKGKAAQAKTTVKSRQLSVKRATAKLPTKKRR